MDLNDIFSSVFIIIGGVFYFAGTVGLLRFPDVYTRLHALTKADNLGLGFIALAIALQLSSYALMLKLLLIWILVMIAGACVAQLIARGAILREIPFWKR